MNTYNERGIRNNAGATAQHIPGPTFGQSPASGPAPTTAGHHRHDIVNKLDPRVDSTKDKLPMKSNIPEGTYGPHSSRLANALDPRVDSDADRSHNTGMMSGGAGNNMMAHGYNTNVPVPEGTYGPHSSRMANALDPRVDSDADRSRMAPGGAGHHQGMGVGGGVSNAGMMGSGPGPAPKTAGPHKSDLLNKLDPRVDSKTGAVSGTYGAGGGVQGHGTSGRYA